MQAEQMRAFNLQQEFVTFEEVTSEWKWEAGYDEDSNPFTPATFWDLNLKSPVLYELLWNSALELPEEEISHATKASSEWALVENTLEEMPDPSQVLPFLTKV